MIRLSVVLALTFLIALPVSAESVTPREGWRVIPTEQSYSELLGSVRQAVTEEGMAMVTDVGPTEAAAHQRGELMTKELSAEASYVTGSLLDVAGGR